MRTCLCHEDLSDLSADTAFPNLDENPDWELEEKGEMQEEKGVRFSFDVYKKR